MGREIHNQTKWARFIWPILASIVVCPAIVDQICAQATTRRLNHVEDLAKLSYQDLHRLAIQDQIEFHLRPQKSLETRRTRSLDGIYDFCLDRLSPESRGFAENWHSKDLRSSCPNSTLYRMPVPSAFEEVTSNPEVRNHLGWLWYQRTIYAYELALLESPDSNPNWYIQFESANYLAIVWLQPLNDGGNDCGPAKLVGSHVGGYLPFRFNLSDIVNGSSCAGGRKRPDFRLTVAVSNVLSNDTIPSGETIDLSEQVGEEFKIFKPDFDFFHYAGLMGAINLFALAPNLHIESVEVRIPAPANGRLNSVGFYVCLAGALSKELIKTGIAIETLIKSHNGAVVAKQSNSLKQLDQNCETIFYDARKFTRWTPAKGRLNHIAQLYLASLSLRSIKGEPLDQFELRFGLPEDTQSQLLASELVGHKSLPLQGFGMHMESPGGFSGRYMSQAAIQKDMYLLKSMGVTLIRTSHYPYSSEYLDACDEHGILVIAECQAVGLNSFDLQYKLKLHQQLLKEMMQRDQHHPSILAWSVANEPQSQLLEAEPYFTKLLAFARDELASYTKEARRPLTGAIAQPWEADRVAHLLDVIMLNFYFGWYEYLGVISAVKRPLRACLAGWSKRHPGKPLLISEFGAEAPAGQHSSTLEPFSEEYQNDLLVSHEMLFNKLLMARQSAGNTTSANCNLLDSSSCPVDGDEVIDFRGAMIWNFADFSTHNSLSRPRGNQKGLFSRDRQPKLAVSLIRHLYLDRLAKSS